MTKLMAFFKVWRGCVFFICWKVMKHTYITVVVYTAGMKGSKTSQSLLDNHLHAVGHLFSI